MSKVLKLDVFGRTMWARRTDNGWKLFIRGQEGKDRPGPNVVPSDIVSPEDLVDFLSDLYHESARPHRPRVIILSGEEI